MSDQTPCITPSANDVEELAFKLGIRCDIHEPPTVELGMLCAVEFLWPTGDGFSHRVYPTLAAGYDAILKYEVTNGE